MYARSSPSCYMLVPLHVGLVMLRQKKNNLTESEATAVHLELIFCTHTCIL